MKLTSWGAITGWRLLLVSQFPWQKWPRKWQPGCQDAWFRFCCAFGLLQWSLVGKKPCISCWCFAGCIVCTTTRRFFCDAIEGSFVGHRHWGDIGRAHQKVTPSEGSAFCRSLTIHLSSRLSGCFCHPFCFMGYIHVHPVPGGSCRWDFGPIWKIRSHIPTVNIPSQ